MGVLVCVRQLGPADLPFLGEIDRSEHLRLLYSVEDQQLVSRQADVEVPAWDPVGHGDHSVAGMIGFAQPVVARGGDFLGAFVADELAGIAIAESVFESGLAWLALLHVNRGHRRRGVASVLWEATADRARAAGSYAIYVSATPSDSAVAFYLSRGCRLATPSEINDDLFALEPGDIHLICELRPTTNHSTHRP